MCLLIQGKVKDIAKISKKRRKQIWDANPDGATIAVASNTGTYAQRGIMKFETMEYMLDLIAWQFHPDATVVVHWRWATTGEVSPSNTHGFNIGVINDNNGKGWNTMLFHNGVVHVPMLGLRGTGKKSKASDTLALSLAIKEQVRYSAEYDKLASTKEVAQKLKQYDPHSRYILLSDGSHPLGEPRLERLGNFTEEKGIFYSNMNFIPHRYSAMGYNRLKGELEDYGDYYGTKIQKQHYTPKYYPLKNDKPTGQARPLPLPTAMQAKTSPKPKKLTKA